MAAALSEGATPENGEAPVAAADRGLVSRLSRTAANGQPSACEELAVVEWRALARWRGERVRELVVVVRDHRGAHSRRDPALVKRPTPTAVEESVPRRLLQRNEECPQ
jgi:hypothetical protein